MKIAVVSILPELVEGALCAGVVGRAATVRRHDPTGSALEAAPDRPLSVTLVSPRDFTSDRHRTVDDTPYGGGPGMVMKPEPLLAAIAAAERELAVPARRVLLSPVGRPLDQAAVRRLSQQPALILVCGRYEGVDERVIEEAIDEEISLGDYVLSGGELAAMVLIDAVVRQLPGALNDAQSAAQESFVGGLLDCPHYTRPETYAGERVPEVLLSGHHAEIERWRLKQALGRTWLRRPDLLARRTLSGPEQALLAEFRAEHEQGNRKGRQG